MNTFVLLAMSALGLVCLGIPVTAVVVVYRDELPALADRLRRALAFDPYHPALSYRDAR